MAPKAPPSSCGTKSRFCLESHPLTLPSPPPALHVLISTLKGSAPHFFTTVLGDPAPHSPLISLHPDTLPVPTRLDPASAQLTRAVKSGGDGVQKGVLRGQQPLHDRHGPGFGFEALRGLRSARPGRRGRATGGAGAPHAPACLLPSSRRRCLCALNQLVLSSASQHLGTATPTSPHLPTGQVLPGGLGPRPPRGSAPGGAARDTRSPPLWPSSQRGAAHACLLGRDSETRPPSRLEVMRWGSNGGHALLSG